VDVDRLAVDNRSTNNSSAIRDGGQSTRRGDRSKVGGDAVKTAIDAKDGCIFCITQSRSSFGNRIELRKRVHGEVEAVPDGEEVAGDLSKAP
jgi:hypothetical protein